MTQLFLRNVLFRSLLIGDDNPISLLNVLFVIVINYVFTYTTFRFYVRYIPDYFVRYNYISINHV